MIKIVSSLLLVAVLSYCVVSPALALRRGKVTLSRISDSDDQANALQDDAPFVRHFVAFRFLQNVTQSKQDEVMKKFLDLFYECVNPDTGLPYIVSLDAGYANSPEGVDQGMQQGYVITFRSVEDRDYYVGRPFFNPYDPHHDAFKQFVGPLLDSNGVFVFDYSAVVA